MRGGIDVAALSEQRLFINREAELSFLEEKWRSRHPQLIVIWGKRRVGKTELVRRFLLGRPHILLPDGKHKRPRPAGTFLKSGRRIIT